MRRPLVRPALAALAAGAVTVPLALVTAGPAAAADPTLTHTVVTGEGGVPIYTNVFVPDGVDAADPAPVVLRTHGFGGHGSRTVAELTSTERALLDAGYVLITWDERGFGYSGGEVMVDKPDFEGRDASAVLDYAATLPEVLLDEPGDPVTGMSGGSYAGGIQTVLATFDDRVDAIAPEISWSDLRYSLYENDVPNLGWGSGLVALGSVAATTEGLRAPTPPGPQTGGLDSTILESFANAAATGMFTAEQEEYFAESSLLAYDDRDDAGPLDVPTLVMNGSVDTLFDPRDGYRIIEQAQAAGADTKFVVFCGGHVSCPSSYTDAEDREHLDELTVDWMDRYLRDDESVDTGAPVEFRTNDDTAFQSDEAWPPRRSSLVRIPVDGSAVVTAATASQPDDGGAPVFIASPNEDGDPRAFSVEAFDARDEPVDVVGFGEARLSVSGTGPFVNLFVKLVDRESGEVLNLQENAYRVDDLSAEPQEITVPLTGFSYTLPAGHHLDVQVSTTSQMHYPTTTPAQVDVVGVVDVPVVAPRPLAQGRATDAACPAGEVPDAGFGDVSDQSVHAPAVDCVTWWGVAEGRSTDVFDPESVVTRGQMASFVARLLRESDVTVVAPAVGVEFSDVLDGSVHEPNIEYLAARGVVQGLGDGRFGPDEPVQRDQMASFLVRAQTLLDGGTKPTSDRDHFADDGTSVHEDNINRSAGLGLTAGVAGGGYEPEEPVTRQQMASFLARELDVATRYGFATPPSEG